MKEGLDGGRDGGPGRRAAGRAGLTAVRSHPALSEMPSPLGRRQAFGVLGGLVPAGIGLRPSNLPNLGQGSRLSLSGTEGKVEWGGGVEGVPGVELVVGLIFIFIRLGRLPDKLS